MRGTCSRCGQPEEFCECRLRVLALARPGSYRPPVQAGRWQPTTGMRKSTAVSMRKLAAKLKGDHEEMGSHLHVEDAARALERGDHDAAGRHLDAATANMTPQSLMRHGIVHDEDYHTAKANMDAIHRHRLLVRDIQDAHERNLQLLQDRPPGPDADDGANTVKPAQRIGEPDQEAAGQPRGGLPSGGSDKNVAEPKSITKWTVTKQIAASRHGDLTTEIDMSMLPGGDFPMIDLAFDPLQPRDRHGRWTSGPGGRLGITYEGGKGHYENARTRLEARLREHAAVNPSLPPKKPRELPPLLQNGGPPGGFSKEADKRIAAHAGGNPATDWRAALAQYDQMVKKRKITFGPNGFADKYPGKNASTRAIQAFLDSKVINYANEYGLSAETGRLAVTPAPRGRPGGPGLYDVQGNEHSPYLQNIVKALIRSGHDANSAYAIARAAIRRWSRGGGHVHPEVRAAAAGAESQENAAQARAHAHSNYRAGARAVELGFFKSEPRGKDGEWIAGLGGLADKLDRDHPGEGLGEHVRKARDAASAGDIDRAGQHLEAAQATLRSSKFYAGGKGDATYRSAAGNSFLLGQKIKQLPGAMGMSNTWSDVERAITLATVDLVGTAQGAAKDNRSTSGPTAGQFIPAGASSGTSSKPGSTAKPGSTGKPGATGKPGRPGPKGGALKPGAKKPVSGKKSPPGKPTAGGSSRAQKKAGLLAQASRDRAQAKQLEGKRAQLLKAIAAAMASASGKKSAGQKGAKTSAGATKTSSTAPASKTGTKPGTAKPGAKPGAKAPKPGSLASLKQQLTQVNAQIKQLLTQAAQATAQAAKL